MATTAGIDAERLEELRGAFSGSVLQPGGLQSETLQCKESAER